jgi:hypothetical protein
MHLIFMFLRVLPTLPLVPFVPTVTERIIICNYGYNNICDEDKVDMLFTFEYN